MRGLLTSPSARWAFIGGALFVCGHLTHESSGGDALPRPTADPVLQPVPLSCPNHPRGEEIGTDAEQGVLRPSAATHKLVLVSAEIDADAEYPQVLQIEKGSSFRKARKAAIDDLPLDRLTPRQRQFVSNHLDSISVFRRLPAFQCELDPRVHDYFLQHPDVAVSIWRAMAISQLQMMQTEPFRYEIDTRDGTTGVATVLHQSRESCLVCCEGMFKSPYLANAIMSKALMHLRTSVTADREGRVFVTHQADLFVAFPSQGVGTIAKLVSPVSNAIIDRNFQEICLFIHVMWQAMTKQPGWVEQLAKRLEDVPAVRKDELIRLTADVYVAHQTDVRRRNGLPVSLEVIAPPSRRAADGAIDLTR